MEWTRSDTIALANNTCTQCHGVGLRMGRKGIMNPCNCVLRAIFRACYARFRHCASKEKHMSRISLEFIPGREGKATWARKDEEYMADFILVSRRALSEFDFQIFKFHFLLGADWKLCCRKMNIDRGTFFHSVYRLQQELGRVFRELEPYSLFPLDDYFQGPIRAADSKPAQSSPLSRIRPPLAGPRLRPALRKSA
jgi:hypothetical protein